MTGPCGSSCSSRVAPSPSTWISTTLRIPRPPVPRSVRRSGYGRSPSGMPSRRWASGSASAVSSRYGGRPPAIATGRYSRIRSQSGIDHGLVERVVVQRHLVAARDPRDLGLGPAAHLLDRDRLRHRERAQRERAQGEQRGRTRDATDRSGGAPRRRTWRVGERGEARQDQDHQRDQEGMLPEEGAQRHPDVAGLGQVREEHLPEMLVALADEEEIDRRHGRVDRGDHPEARDHGAAARVPREQREAAEDEQLEAQERQVQAEPVEQHGGHLAPRGAPGEPRHEQEAVGGQQDEVERDQAEGVGGQPDGRRGASLIAAPKRDTKNPPAARRWRRSRPPRC